MIFVLEKISINISIYVFQDFLYLCKIVICIIKNIVPITKNIVIKDSWKLILLSNFKGIITPLATNTKKHGKIVMIGIHNRLLKIVYKDKIWKIQNNKTGKKEI